MDDARDFQVDDPDSFLEELRATVEAPAPNVDLAMELRPDSFKPFEPRCLITATEVKYAMRARNSASGPDGISAKRPHAVPMAIVRGTVEPHYAAAPSASGSLQRQNHFHTNGAGGFYSNSAQAHHGLTCTDPGTA
ncbi:hypothetical protein MTO96_038437 [Rhipicephalus appendiculatus]